MAKMKIDEFNKVVEEQIKSIKSTLVKKAKEYATDDDRLHNFNLAGVLLDCSSVFALAGMMTKHTVSVYDIIRQYNKLGITPTNELLNEKIGDLINYLILLKAMFISEINSKPKTICGFGDTNKDICFNFKPKYAESIINRNKQFTIRTHHKYAKIGEVVRLKLGDGRNIMANITGIMCKRLADITAEELKQEQCMHLLQLSDTLKEYYPDITLQSKVYFIYFDIIPESLYPSNIN
jgi:uncharacterized protein YqfB (UPF0267 family)